MWQHSRKKLFERSRTSKILGNGRRQENGSLTGTAVILSLRTQTSPSTRSTCTNIIYTSKTVSSPLSVLFLSPYPQFCCKKRFVSRRCKIDWNLSVSRLKPAHLANHFRYLCIIKRHHTQATHTLSLPWLLSSPCPFIACCSSPSRHGPRQDPITFDGF